MKKNIFLTLVFSTVILNSFLCWAEDTKAPTTVVEKNIIQRVDHYTKSSKTFLQRYWINDSFALNKSSPILIYLCGESACTPDMASPNLDRWAQPVNGYTVSIEHRYYGKSIPTSDLSTENLRYLEIKQVLKDYVQFINHLRKVEGLAGPIVLAGGSYSGMLAAMMRVDYSSLVAGAWSSSGPLHLIANYYQYDEEMTKVIPESCKNSLRELNLKIENEIVDDIKFNEMSHEYLVPNMKNKKDFLFGLIDIAAAAVQYNRTNWFCDKFKGGNIIEEYGQFVNEIAKSWDYKIDSYGFSTISDVSLSSKNASMRAFFYQQCSEIGLFQPATKNISLSTRSQLLDANYMKDGCERVFGRSFNLQNTVDRLNNHYYKQLTKVNGPSNILSTAGSLDPFWKISITPNNQNATNKNMVSVDIKDGAHCSEMNYNDESPESVKAAAELAKTLIAKWVQLR